MNNAEMTDRSLFFNQNLSSNFNQNFSPEVLSQSGSPRCCRLYLRGEVPYAIAWAWQKSLLADRKADPNLDDALILLEHPPVYTLGQGADTAFLKFDPAHTGWDVVRVERGGEVTYHCPGQLVAYPILNLRFYQQDLHWYLRQLETVVIQVLAEYGLVGDRIPGLTGVWVEGKKVAAIGIKVSRWITMHGLALNVCPDLSGFAQIVPCGIADRPVGSLAEWIPDITLVEVRQRLLSAFAAVFQVQFVPEPLSESCTGGSTEFGTSETCEPMQKG